MYLNMTFTAVDLFAAIIAKFAFYVSSFDA